ncbi:MAG TPA: hypothetical protein DCZ62_09290 [Ruminococcus sp.]|nr:hypothetical protein [Ruminococcus sp.]
MKKLFAALIALTTLACTFASCGDKPEKKASNSSSEAVSESSDTEVSGYENGEEAAKAFFTLMSDEDYDNAFSVLMPEKIRDIVWYTISEEDSSGKRIVEWDEESLDELFGYWDYYHKMTFQETVSEETYDEEEKERDLNYINAWFCSARKAAESYDELPEPDVLDDKMNELIDEVIDFNDLRLKADIPSEYEHASDIKKLNVRLSDDKDVDFYHTVTTYYVDGEGWFVFETEEAGKDGWSNGIAGLSDLGDSIFGATAEVLNGFFNENKFGLAEEDWTTTKRVISPDPELCYNFDPEAAKAVCDGIAEAVEGLDNVVYFVVINGSEIENIVLSRKVNHKYVCIFPHGCIDITEDEYENASDLSYEQAYDIYMELVKSE